MITKYQHKEGEGGKKNFRIFWNHSCSTLRIFLPQTIPENGLNLDLKRTISEATE